MKKIKEKALGIISKAALANARKEVNSACVLFGYQPKMPKDLKQQIKGKQNLLVEIDKSVQFALF